MKEPLWKLSRAAADGKVVAILEAAGISGPQVFPKGLRYRFGTAVAIAGTPLPTIAAEAEARGFVARMWMAWPGRLMYVSA